MKKSIILNILLNIILFTVFSCSYSKYYPAYAQTPENEQSVEAGIDGIRDNATITTLGTIIQSVQNLKYQLKTWKKEHRAARTKEERTKVEGEINMLNQQIRGLENDFEKIYV